MSKFVKILYVNELGPNDYDINLLKSLPGVCDVVVADYRYRVGDYRENKDYLSNLRQQWDHSNQFKPKKYDVTSNDLCKFIDMSLNELVNYYLSKVNCIYIAGSRFDPSAEYCMETPKRVNPDIRREQFEIRLMQVAMERGIPTLVICAGMWRIASAFGVKSTALPEVDVRAYHEQWKNVKNPDKNTMLTPGSALQQIHARTKTNMPLQLLVNSTHWRAAPRPEEQHESTAYNRRFITTAWDSKHGTLEAIEAKHNAQLWGMQWHNELVEPGTTNYETHRGILEKLLCNGGMYFSKKQAVCREIKTKLKCKL